MSLANLVIPEREVSYGDAVIKVTGLDMEGIVVLLQEDRDTMDLILNTEKLSLATLLKTAPNFCAKMIAHAAGEPKQWRKVKKLPFGIQMQLVESVWELTHLDMDTVGKVIGLLAEAAANVNDELASETLKVVDAHKQESQERNSSTRSQK